MKSRFIIMSSITGLTALILTLPYPSVKLSQAFCSISIKHPLGCSPLGEDMALLVFWGIFKTIFIAVVGRFIAVAISTLGFLASHFSNNFVFEIIARIAESVMTIPSLLLALSFGFLLSSGFVSMIIAIALSEWAMNQKWMLNRKKEFERHSYILASTAMGASKLHLFRYHLWPLVIRDVVFLIFLYLPTSILTVASLEFLGLSTGGLPGLGFLVALYKDYIFIYPNISLPPIIVVIATVLLLLGFKKRLDFSLSQES